MSYSKLFKKIVENNCCIGFNSADGEIVIKEKDKSAKLKKVTIGGLSNDTFAFKFDYYSEVSKYFNKGCEYGLNKGCDGVIFSSINGTRYIFICELKSGSPSGYLKQFKNTKLFLKYLNSILKEYYNTDISNHKVKFVLFTKTTAGKRKTSNEIKKPINKNGIKVYHIDNRSIINIGKIC